jgi:glycosyltransferase involved in cell wall biosynthesis
MKQIAVLFEGDINRRLGVFNAVISRVKHLQQIADYKIDVHMLQVYDGWLMRRLRHSKKVDHRPDEIVTDGVKVHITWFRRRWSDVVRHRIFHKAPRALLKRLHRLGWEMRGHDLVTAHDRIAGHAAVFAGKKLHIPCFITWHGASIYTDPPRDAVVKDMTIKLLHSADCNFFVSKGLLDKAHAELTDGFPAEVLLNGASEQFNRYNDERRMELRKHYGIDEGKRVVAFVGRFEPVKNVTLLPDIYKQLEERYGKPLDFWAIGDGIQLEETRRLMEEKGVKCHFTGKVAPEEIPDMLNCVDLLVLPSSLEGLPLVVIEALSCGAHVVATNVIGTAEAVGRENAIDLGDNFVDRFTTRAVQLLQDDIEQKLPPEISWDATAEKENLIYHKYLEQSP